MPQAIFRNVDAVVDRFDSQRGRGHKSMSTYQRGDSGSPGMKMTMMSASTIWNAIGNRQVIVEGSKNENPRSIQYEIMTPNTISVPSIMTIWPRRCDFEVSDCHVGTVEVFIPCES